MNKLKLIDTIKQKNSNVDEVTFVKVYCEDESVFLDINAKIYCISLDYTGSIFIDSPSPLFRYYYGRNRITIYNPFKQDFPRNIMDYSGEFIVNNATITNFSGYSIRPVIINNQKQDIITIQKTKVEDDTLIIIDDSGDKEFKTHIKTGISRMPTGRSRTSGSTQVKGKSADRPLLKPVRRAVNVKTPKKGGY